MLPNLRFSAADSTGTYYRTSGNNHPRLFFSRFPLVSSYLSTIDTPGVELLTIECLDTTSFPFRATLKCLVLRWSAPARLQTPKLCESPLRQSFINTSPLNLDPNLSLRVDQLRPRSGPHPRIQFHPPISAPPSPPPLSSTPSLVLTLD